MNYVQNAEHKYSQKKKRHTYNCKIYKINVLYADFAAVSSVYPIKIPIFVI